MKNKIIKILSNLIADIVFILIELHPPFYITLVTWLVKLEQEILVKYLDK